ncbi:MAG: DUF1836 domain-containing protein [Erysipelotrichales bacterium]|nr:DUF1836 domain-containing protein [Erysipelotrichales bacterium]
MEKIRNKEAEIILSIKLPRYEEIPDTGLYLEQVTKYINGFFWALPHIAITPSMVSNYVKHGLLPKCVKKQYSREQIMRLILITFGKTVLSMEDLKLLFELQSKVYPNDVAYNYFLLEYENVLKYIFGLKPQMDIIGTTDTLEKQLLRNAIISFAHKMYVEITLDYTRNEQMNTK